MLAVTVRLALALAVAGSCLYGQRLRIYTEFQRVGPDGAILSADRADRPRELISPAVPRNAWITFRVAVEAPPGKQYYLYVGQNPDNTARTTLYQETYTKVGDEWAADKLKRVDQPIGGILASGQKAQSYLLDVFIPPRTPTGRFRLEVQLNVGDHWIISPLEMRVQEIAGSGRVDAFGWIPEVSDRADSVVDGPLREYLCARKMGGAVQPLDNIRAITLRNVLQDLDIARGRERRETRSGVGVTLVKAAGYPSLDAFCKSTGPAPRGAEWWMRARDYLYQGLPIR